MISETQPGRLQQPLLFVLEESAGSFELFPEVWGALEDLTKSDSALRRSAIDRLIELRAPRLSPLAAYVLSTRLDDPDIEIRCRVIRLVGETLGTDENGLPAPEEVRRVLLYYLSHIRTRMIFAILQAASREDSLLQFVERILDACPYAGANLTDLLTDTHAPLEIRHQAAIIIGRVGYLDAIPALEKIESRLEARLNGQKTMPFAPHPSSNETDLLPSIRETINILRAP